MKVESLILKIILCLLPLNLNAFMRERVLHEEGAKLDINKKWNRYFKSEEENLKHMIKILYRSPTGRAIITAAKEKANTQGRTLLEILRVGDSSITDTTLIRKFSPDNPSHVLYETRSHVYIDKDLSLYDGILDMAHELTHYTEREPFNPYTLNFDLEDFVKSTIEGKGGEVDAYLVECRVLKELFGKRFRTNSNCYKVFNENTQQFSKNLGVQKFYQVGSHIRDFTNNVSANEFHYISNQDPIFISSAYGLPYPIAAIKEYQTIMSKVCRNDKRRIQLLKEQLSSTRRGTGYRTLQSLTQSFSQRCP